MIIKRLILMNTEKKIFVLMKKSPKPYLFLPSISENIMQNQNRLGYFILDSIVFDSNWNLVEEFKKKRTCFYTENNHLLPYNYLTQIEYYMKQKDLSEGQIRSIMNYCYTNRIVPDFYRVEELLQVFTDENLSVSYEEELPKVLMKICKDNNKGREKHANV